MYNVSWFMAVAVFLILWTTIAEKIVLSLYVCGCLWTGFITCIQVVFSNILCSPDIDLTDYLLLIFALFCIEEYPLTYKNL